MKFAMIGKNELVYHTVREINPGEELTGFYGSHYFGEQNQECHCRTCQSRQDNDISGVKTNAAPRRHRQNVKSVSNTLPRALQGAQRQRRSINVLSIQGTGTALTIFD
jgi:hypothetical protein